MEDFILGDERVSSCSLFNSNHDLQLIKTNIINSGNRNELICYFQWDMIDEFFAAKGPRKLMFFYQEQVVSVLYFALVSMQLYASDCSPCVVR